MINALIFQILSFSTKIVWQNMQRIQNIIWLLINRWLPKKKLRKRRTKMYEIYSRLLLGVTTRPVFTRTVLCFWLCYSGHGLELIPDNIMSGKLYYYKIPDKKNLKVLWLLFTQTIELLISIKICRIFSNYIKEETLIFHSPGSVQVRSSLSDSCFGKRW